MTARVTERQTCVCSGSLAFPVFVRLFLSLLASVGFVLNPDTCLASPFAL